MPLTNASSHSNHPSDKHYAYPCHRLLVFAKSPLLGFAKTRLQPQLPPEFSLALHSRLTSVALKQWSQANICPVECWVAGDRQNFSEKILGITKGVVEGEDEGVSEVDLTALPVHKQPDGSLGERLIEAIASTFTRYTDRQQEPQGVLVVGTDCPFIDETYLTMACEQLAQHDVVIGPADDGGYVLLGLKVPNRELFTDIRWGESSVLASTIAKLKASGLSYFELPSLSDIDQPEDLAKLKVHDEFTDLLDQANRLSTGV